MPKSALILQIVEEDNKFVIGTNNPKADPIGVAPDIGQAIGTAIREAKEMCREWKVRVAILVQQNSGTFRVEQIVNPPVSIRRKK